jgi:hypothetical protein
MTDIHTRRAPTPPSAGTTEVAWVHCQCEYLLGPTAGLTRRLEALRTLCALVDCITEPLAWVYGDRWMPRATDEALRSVIRDMGDV